MLTNNVSSKKELTAQFLWRSSVWPLPPIHLLGSWRAPPWLRLADCSSSDYSILWRSSSGDLSVNNESLSWSQWSAKDHHQHRVLLLQLLLLKEIIISQSQWSLIWSQLLLTLQNHQHWLYKLVLSWDSFYKPLWLTDWIQIHRPTVFLQQCHHHLFHLLQHLLRKRRRSCHHHQNMESKSFTSQE